MLTSCLKDKIVSSQHAYIPGKGTTTAWEDLLNKVEKYKYIYEIDLKQCFPNIQGKYITEELRELGVPFEYYSRLEGMNRSVPKPIVDDQEEKKRMNEEGKGIAERIQRLTVQYNETGIRPPQLVPLMELFMDRYAHLLGEEVKPTEDVRGLPQGANTSPILTELVLDK